MQRIPTLNQHELQNSPSSLQPHHKSPALSKTNGIRTRLRKLLPRFLLGARATELEGLNSDTEPDGFLLFGRGNHVHEQRCIR